MITHTIKGLDQLQAALEKLRDEDAKKIAKGALKEGADLTRDAIVDNAPEETGFLKEHFNVKMTTLREGIGGEAFIGPAGKIVYPKRGNQKKTIAVASVARFFEFGTAKMQPSAFMRAAWTSVQEQVLQSIIDFIRKQLFTTKYH